LRAQNVGINTTGSAPHSSAGLDIDYTNRGILIPRVALTAANSASPITSPQTSLLIYNTATSGTAPNNVFPGYYYWNGSSWSRLDNSNAGDWRLTGNTGIDSTVNYLGTTDGRPLILRTNGIERLRLAATTANSTFLRLTGSTSNQILYNTAGVAAPSVTTRSAGTKVVWYPQVSGTEVDYATGIESFTLWQSIPGNTSSYQHRFYGGTQRLLDIRGDNRTLFYGAGDNVFTAPTSGFVTLNVEGSMFMPSGQSLWLGNTADVGDRLRLHQTGADSYIDFASGFLQFRTGTTDRVRITNTGRVGIGTTTPVQLLDVNGRMAVQNGVIQRGTTEINVTNDLGLYSQVSGHWIRIASNAAPIKFFTDQGGGNSAGTNAIMALEPANGGGVQINAEISGTGNAVAPLTRAALEVVSTTKGILIPRLTRAQRDAMGTTLHEGLLIYNTDDDCVQFWDNKATPLGGNGFWNSLCEWCEEVVIISSNQTGFNLNDFLGGARARRYCVYINSGVTLQAAGNGGGSGVAGNPGFNATTMPNGARVVLHNYGNILAGGGNGGHGSRESDLVCAVDICPQVGGAGGHGIVTNSNVPIRVFNHGLIRAGGGGGGGGGAGCCAASGGGGGGAGTPAGSGGAGQTSSCVQGTICVSCSRNATSGAGSPGTATTGGTGGGGANSGTTSCPGTCNGQNGQPGGSGGVNGVAGSNGGNSPSSTTAGCPSGASGGIAGLSLQGNGSGSSLVTMTGGTTIGSVNP